MEWVRRRLFATCLLSVVLALSVGESCLKGSSPSDERDYPIPKESIRHADVPVGKLEGPISLKSNIFPGTQRDYWLYVPSQYEADKPACLLVVQDGLNRAKEWRLPEVMDNLIHAGEMPVTIGIFVDPGVVPAAKEGVQPRYNRSFEYDSLGDTYARFLIEELLPDAVSRYNISSDPNHRAIAGASSGGVCAFNVAWERPDAFRRVISTIGTFVGLRGANELPVLVRKTEPKPIRVFLQDGDDDLNIYAGDWWLANQEMLSALEWSGYDVEHRWAEGGGHNGKHAASIMPEALRWLWRNFPEPILARSNVSHRPNMDLLIEGADWQQMSSGHESVDAMTCNFAGVLYFSDSRSGRTFWLDEENKTRVFKELPGRVSAMRFGPDDKLYVVRDNKHIVRIDTGGNEETIVKDQRCHRLVTLPDGFYFTDDVANKIYWSTYAGKLHEAAGLSDCPVALVPTPDQAFVYVATQGQQSILNFMVSADYTLSHRQRLGYLHLAYLEPSSKVSAMVADEQGRIFVASDLGIQVMDQLGRVNRILNKPSSHPITGIVIGGQLRDTLFVSDGTAVYSRKLKIKGVDSYAPPVTPPVPQL